MNHNSKFDATAARAALADAILPHVPFDGWSQPAFDAALRDLGIDPALGRMVCPRGAVDLAADLHRRGDAAMLTALAVEDMSALRYRDRVALAVRLRIDAADPELTRRAASVFALPQNAALGAALIWGTVDAIWNALGDTSADLNWYSKRATLSAVYSSTLLYWMGDDSAGHAESWAFLDRRIDNVMGFEKLKSKLPFLKTLMAAGRAPAHVRSAGETP